MISDRLHPLLWNLSISSNSLDSLQNERLNIWVFEQSFAGALRGEEFDIELGLFRVNYARGSKVADLVAKPCSTVVAAFEWADSGVFVCLHSDLEGEIISLAAWVCEEYFVTFGQISLEPFCIIS